MSHIVRVCKSSTQMMTIACSLRSCFAGIYQQKHQQIGNTISLAGHHSRILSMIEVTSLTEIFTQILCLRKNTWLLFHWSRCVASWISQTERFDWWAGNWTITSSDTLENHISFKFKDDGSTNWTSNFLMMIGACIVRVCKYKCYHPKNWRNNLLFLQAFGRCPLISYKCCSGCWRYSHANWGHG